MSIAELRAEVDQLKRKVWRLMSQDGGIKTLGVTAPVTNTGTAVDPILGLAITTSAPGGAVVAQTSTPGTQQSNANYNLAGKGKATQHESVTTASTATANYASSSTGTALLAETTGAAGTAYPTIVAKASASQTGEVFQSQNSSGTRLAGLDIFGFFDMVKLKIGGVIFADRQSSFPGTPATGQQCTRSDLLYSEWVYDGAAWQQLTVPGKATNFTMGGTPPTNMRVFRTDRGREYFYNGSIWLSSTEFSISFAPRAGQPFPQAQQLFDGAFVRPATQENGVYVLDYDGVFIPQSVAQSATNYYTITFYMQTTAVNTTVTITGDSNTQAATTISNRYYFSGTLNYQASTSYVRSVIALDPILNPGTFSLSLNVRYRLVG